MAWASSFMLAPSVTYTTDLPFAGADHQAAHAQQAQVMADGGLLEAQGSQRLVTFFGPAASIFRIHRVGPTAVQSTRPLRSTRFASV